MPPAWVLFRAAVAAAIVGTGLSFARGSLEFLVLAGGGVAVAALAWLLRRRTAATHTIFARARAILTAFVSESASYAP